MHGSSFSWVHCGGSLKKVRTSRTSGGSKARSQSCVFATVASPTVVEQVLREPRFDETYLACGGVMASTPSLCGSPSRATHARPQKPRALRTPRHRTTEWCRRGVVGEARHQNKRLRRRWRATSPSTSIHPGRRPTVGQASVHIAPNGRFAGSWRGRRGVGGPRAMFACVSRYVCDQWVHMLFKYLRSLDAGYPEVQPRAQDGRG